MAFDGRNKDYGAYVLRRRLGWRYRVAYTSLASLLILLAVLVAGIRMYVDYLYGNAGWEVDLSRLDFSKMEPLETYAVAAYNPDLSNTEGSRQPVRGDDADKSFSAPKIVDKEDIVFQVALETVDEEEAELAELEEYVASLVDQTDTVTTGGLLFGTGDELQAHMPSFPGGVQALMQWLDKAVVYPRKCINDKVEGEVVVTFLVDAEGKVRSPEICTSVDPLLDRAVLSAVKRMPTWEPAQKEPHLPLVRYTLPVVFNLK